MFRGLSTAVTPLQPTNYRGVWAAEVAGAQECFLHLDTACGKAHFHLTIYVHLVYSSPSFP